MVNKFTERTCETHCVLFVTQAVRSYVCFPSSIPQL
jgi:hypothetical protein